MDSQILRDLFNACIQAATLLGRDPAVQTRLRKARDRLPPNQIGAAGQLQEWLEDWDLQAPQLHHRHVSHLYGFFPSAQISLRETPDLARAVRKSLELRGDTATGWGLAWRLNLWARLQDSEHAYSVLMNLLAPDRTYPNLFDAHPPFQIDGNFGGTAGIAEMLLQSHTGEIELLPSLPKAWATGSVNGLRTPGNTEISIQWKNGVLLSATVKKRDGGRAPIRYRDKRWELMLKPGETRVLQFGQP
jgi:alpha-L-fucosidase 2